PALLQANHFFKSKIPAARTLAEISSDCSQVTNLRRSDRVCGFRESRETLSHFGMFFELCQGHQRADCETCFGVALNLVESANALEVDQARRPSAVVFHRGQKILA